MKKFKKVISIISAISLVSAIILTSSAFAYSTGKYQVSAQWPNMRSGPSLNYPVTGQLQKGSYVDVVEVQGEWGKMTNGSWVRLKGGFVNYVGGSSSSNSSSSYKTGTYRVKYNGTNIRSGASLSHSIVTRVNSGTQVNVTKTSGEWGYIPSLQGWLRLNGFADYVGSGAQSSAQQNSSNQSETLVTKALAHKGYLETTYSNGAFWSKFGSWYGSAVGDSSFAYQPWCAMFVSYVANESGISRDVIPLFASCSIGRSWFESRGQFKYRSSGYIPKRGDIVFFSGHVGIVTGTSGNTVYTVEGNVHDGSYHNYGVRTLSHSMSSGNIIGYATPAYK